ncbi:MAG: MBL fold metallo-hydrolase [Verrucomicrobiae bacterium]|nr:MBL fold metallo-hydrolase [Verrucomicrobiae bacterium]
MSVARLTILVENSTHQPGLQAEHGWSVWIEWGDQAFLFDTGQSGMWLNNARQLKVPLSRLGGVMLSHGHYDHTSGLAALGALAEEMPVYLHPDAFAPKYSVPAGASPRYIGMPQASRDWLQQQGARVKTVHTALEVAPGLWLSGPIPRQNTFEDVGGPFYLDAEGRCPDPLWDDMALGMMTREGLVVLLGCAHAGVVNTLAHFRSLLGSPPVYAVVGGMHLLQASAERLTATMEALEQYQVRRLGVGHCTGFVAAVALSHRFSGRCFVPAAGTRLEFPLP